MTNRNAIAGRNVETLFCNSVGDNVSVIGKLKEAFGIDGRYLNSIKTGIHSFLLLPPPLTYIPFPVDSPF